MTEVSSMGESRQPTLKPLRYVASDDPRLLERSLVRGRRHTEFISWDESPP